MAKSGKTTGGISSMEAEHPLSTKENIIWNSVGNFIYLVSQWLLTYVVVRTLGYESAGIFSLAMSIGTSFYCIASYTMRNFQVSDVVDEYSPNTYLLSRHLTCALSIVACLAFVLANGYDQYTLLCLMAYMLFKASDALSDAFQGIMQKKMRMDYIGISFAIKGILEFILFYAALVLVGDLLTAIIVLAVVSYGVIAVYDRRMALKNVTRGSSSWAQISSLLLTCLPIAVYGFLFNTAAQAPRYFIEGVLGAEQLGYYTSVAMPVVIIQVCANYLFSPLITPMAQHLHDGEVAEFMAILKKTLLAIIVVSVVAFAGFALCGEWLLTLLFGESIVGYTYLLNPLILCTILTALAWFLSAVITIIRKLMALLVASSAMFAIVVIGSVPFIELFGLNGASFILAIALAVFTSACAVIVYQAFRNPETNASAE